MPAGGSRSAAPATLGWPARSCSVPCWLRTPRAPDASAPDGPPLELTLEPPTFGEVDVGDSAQVQVVARNVTSTSVSIEDVHLATDSGAFVIVADSCEHTLLDPDQTCDVTVAFQPATEGDDSAMVQLDTSAGSAEAALGGRGIGTIATVPVPPTIGPTVAPTTSHPPSHPPSGRPSLPPSHPPSSLPPTAPTVVTPPVDASDAARLADCEVRARQATISYDTARSMTVDETQQFVVTATIQEAVPAGTTTTVAPGVTVVAVALRCEVQAQLRGADFRVDPAEFQPGRSSTSRRWSGPGTSCR